MSDLIERLRAILLPCSTCDGTGTVWAPTSGPDPEDLGICHNCNGKGAVKHPVTAEAAAELARLTAEVERLQRIVRDRQHPASEPRDPPEVLRTIGFWPSCGCGECYAIHCLDEQMNEVERLLAELQTALGKVWMLESKIADAQPAPNGALVSAASDGWSDPVGKLMREHIDAAKEAGNG